MNSMQSTMKRGMTLSLLIVFFLGVVMPTVTTGYRVLIMSTGDPRVNSYSSLAVQGCQLAAATNSTVTCEWTSVRETTDLESQLEQLQAIVSTSSDDLFVAVSPMYGTALESIALKFPHKTFAAIDSVVPNPGPNIVGLTFAEEQAGYLAGTVAGMFTTRKKVGVIAGIPLSSLKRFVNGFHSGVMAVCPFCEVHKAFLPSFIDADLGREAATTMITDKGIDVLFGAAGATGSAAILEAARHQVFVIGVDADESQTTFRGRPEIDYLLTSALKRVDVAVRTTIETILSSGKRGGFNVVLDAALNGASLAQPFNSTATRNFTAEMTIALRSATDLCAAPMTVTRENVFSYVFSALQRKVISTNVMRVTGELQPLSTPEPKTWYDLPPFGDRSFVQANMQGHATVYIGQNRLLTWGGQTVAGQYPRNVMILDFDAYQWRREPTKGNGSPPGRMFHAMGFDPVHESVYIFGGQVDEHHVVSETWKYSVPKKEWELVSPGRHPGVRTNMAFAALDRKIYIYGGINAAGALLSDLWVFDMHLQEWEMVVSSGAHVPTLQHSAMVAINSTTLALYGGTTDGGAYSDKLFIHHIPTKSWSHEPVVVPPGSPTPPPVERLRGVVVDNRRVFFTGGLTHQGHLSNSTWVWKLDERLFDLAAYGPLPSGLHSHSIVAFNQLAYNETCKWTAGSALTVCSPQPDPAVVVISGVGNRQSSAVMFSFANPDPLPPPVGQIDPNLKISVMTLNAVGIVMALVFGRFCIAYQKSPVVRASNPSLSLLVLLGCICAHCGITASSAVDSGRIAVQLTAYLVAGGYTIIFAAIVVKMGLIYWIMQAKRRMSVTTLQLVSTVMVCLAVQTALVYVWFMNDVTAVGVLVAGGITWMVISFNKLWAVVCALPVLLLTASSLFLAYKLRHLKSDFNEGQYVALATYAIAVAILVCAPVILLLDAPMVQYIITTTFVTLTTMVVQLCFFVHKVQAVFLDSRKPFARHNRSAFAGAVSGIDYDDAVATVDYSRSGALLDEVNQDVNGLKVITGLRCKYCRQAISLAGGGGHRSNSPLVSPAPSSTSAVELLRKQKGGSGGATLTRGGGSSQAKPST